MNVLSRIVFVPLLALAFLALAPNEAQAIPACDRFGASNTICFYNFNDFGGGECSIDADAFVGPNWNNMDDVCGPFFDNWMNSWINNSGYDGKWATGLNGSGSIFCLNANGQNNSVGSPNTMSSFRVFSGSTVWLILGQRARTRDRASYGAHRRGGSDLFCGVGSWANTVPDSRESGSGEPSGCIRAILGRG